ncbi:hypothetical protein [Muricoccus nepalensis]|nr:hypothetical protein [Roseomonas nepalensis]
MDLSRIARIAELLEQGAIVQPFGTGGRVALIIDGRIEATTEKATVTEARKMRQGDLEQGA